MTKNTAVVMYDPKAAWEAMSDALTEDQLLSRVVIEESWTMTTASGRTCSVAGGVRLSRDVRVPTVPGASFFSPADAHRVDDLLSPAELFFRRGR